MPGMLAPPDLLRLMRNFGYSEPLEFARDHLLASPGAVVLIEGKQVRIPTLVPKREDSGKRCHWLSADGQCTVHAVSPYGCAFADNHLDMFEGIARTSAALDDVMQNHISRGLYSRVCIQLIKEGKVAPAPEILREEILTQVKVEGLQP